MKPNQPSDLTTQMSKETTHWFSFGPCQHTLSSQWLLSGEGGSWWVPGGFLKIPEGQCCPTTAQHGDASAIARRAKLQSRCGGCQHSAFSTPTIVLLKSVLTHLLLWFLLWSAAPSWLRAFEEKSTLSIWLFLAGVNPNSQFMTRYAVCSEIGSRMWSFLKIH